MSLQPKSIVNIPPLPKAITEAIARERFAVFIGAGISRLVGCVGWDQLACNLVDCCLTEGLIYYKEVETLRGRSDHRRTITVCYELLKDAGREDKFYAVMNQALQKTSEAVVRGNIYDEIFKLRGQFITTNADKHFDGKFPNRSVFLLADFHKNRIDKTKLFHIHGSILNQSSLVFRVDDYVDRYQHQEFKEFLNAIFEEYTILFLGYGLTEFELLDIMIRKRKEQKGGEIKHYALMGYYESEGRLAAIDQIFFGKYGVEILAYAMDKNGYEQQIDIIKTWADEINRSSSYLFTSYDQIEQGIREFSVENANRIFQLVQNDIPQQEYFFSQLAIAKDPLSWLGLVKDRGYFEPKRIPLPTPSEDGKGVVISHWSVLDFLHNATIKAASIKDTGSFVIIGDILDNLIAQQAAVEERIDNYRVDWLILKVLIEIPIFRFKKEYFNFLHTSLQTKWGNDLLSADLCTKLFPLIVKHGNRDQILLMLDVLFLSKIDEINTVFSERVSIVDPYWLKEGLSNHKKELADKIGIDAARFAIEKIAAIVLPDPSQFSNVWIVTIEDSSQNHFPDRFEFQLSAFLRDMLLHSPAASTRPLVIELLKNPHPIFRRVAIYTINYHYDSLSDLFWSFESNPMDDEYSKHETYELLSDNSQKLDDAQINQAIDWIEGEEQFIPKSIKEDEAAVEKLIAYRKKEWLSALLPSKNDRVRALFERYNEINSSMLDHPGYAIWSEDHSLIEESPVTSQEMQFKSNSEIAQLLKEYIHPTGREFVEDGLLGILRKTVIDNPSKFSIDLQPFLSVPRRYQNNLVWGFLEAWKAGKDIDWEPVLIYVGEIVTAPEFWEESFVDPFNYRNWLISTIAELIQEGVLKDEHAFDPKLNSIAIDILLSVVNRCDSHVTELKDVVNAVLNSPLGKVYSALLCISLRIARLNPDNPVRWDQKIKYLFDNTLDRAVISSYDFSVVLGKYLANLLYLDHKWVESNINRIFPKENPTQWQATMIAYLFYAARLNKRLFSILNDNNHYQLAIQTEFPDRESTDRLVQHICTRIIENEDNLDDPEGLFAKLLAQIDIHKIRSIVSFFWQFREVPDERIRETALKVWSKLFEVLNKVPLDSGALLYKADLLRMTAFIDKLTDECTESILFSLEHQKENFHSHLLIELMQRVVKNHPHNVARLFEHLIRMGIRPTYKEENIVYIVKTLYECGERDSADRICISYGEAGMLFLKSLFDSNHNT